MIPQRNISLISNKLAKQGGKRVPESVIERDYCLAWLLVGLSQSSLNDKLAFKGGTAIRRCYFKDYRFSEDLDFTLRVTLSQEDILQQFRRLFEYPKHQAGIHFIIEHIEPIRQNTYTFYIAYEGPLPTTGQRKEVKVDITINEHLAFPLEQKTILKSYDEYSDLPEDKKITTYSLNEILTEKTLALLDPARNEPRDLYDFWYLFENGQHNLLHLLHAIEKKVIFRGKTLDTFKNGLDNKEIRYKKLWSMRLAAQMSVLPEFEDVFRFVKRSFRQAGLSG